jgi:adenosylmethionine-8-amino-7-oxononanoate aminotransferase
MLPMSATMVTDAVFEEFQSKNGESRTLYHGTTFCGNPITSAVALAALDVYEEENILGRVQKSAVTLREAMATVAALLDDSPLSNLGMIASIEIKASAGGAARAARMVQQAYQRGLFIRPLGDTIYLWPPLNIRESDLQQMVDILTEAAQS